MARTKKTTISRRRTAKTGVLPTAGINAVPPLPHQTRGWPDPVWGYLSPGLIRSWLLMFRKEANDAVDRIIESKDHHCDGDAALLDGLVSLRRILRDLEDFQGRADSMLETVEPMWPPKDRDEKEAAEVAQ